MYCLETIRAMNSSPELEKIQARARALNGVLNPPESLAEPSPETSKNPDE